MTVLAKQPDMMKALAVVLSRQPLNIRSRAFSLLRASNKDLFYSLQQEFQRTDWNLLIENACADIAGWQKSGVTLTTYFDLDYPDNLRNIDDPPFALFSRGFVPLSLFCSRKCLAVVGSRRADREGVELAIRFSRELAASGVVIISGLALGVDGAAHNGALSSGKKNSTLAVLGSGVDRIYPSQHSGLADELIRSEGILLSQFEPGQIPFPSNFVNRNRIVSGLAAAVLVIQATSQSGSLVTARHAIDQGREVLVLPGDVSNPRFQGSNQLIRQGATLVTSAQEIAEHLGVQLHSTCSDRLISGDSMALQALTPVELKIVGLISEHQLGVDELLRQLGGHTAERELLMLEMKGVLERLPGNMLRLKRCK